MMTLIHTIGVPPPRPLRPLPTWMAFMLVVSIGVALLAASSALTPLYAIYQQSWGFSALTITVIFAIYALAVLLALVTVGSLSDHLGRRPVLIVALLVQAAVMVLFAEADGVSSLILARVLQGLSTGAVLGAIGATLVDLHRVHGSMINAVWGMAGTASGALVAGWFVHALPAPTQLIFLVFSVLFLLQAVGVGMMSETVAREPGTWPRLRMHIALPSRLRSGFWAVAPMLVAAWGLAGFYGSLGPALVRRLSASPSTLLAGLGLFLLAAAGVVAVLLLHRRSPRTLMAVGAGGLLLGVGITEFALLSSSWPLFLIGTVAAGGGFGAGFQGAIRSVLPRAEAHERAGVLSVLYLISYLSMGVPAILAGLVVVHGVGVVPTALGYGAVMMALASLALLRTGVAASSQVGAMERGAAVGSGADLAPRVAASAFPTLTLAAVPSTVAISEHFSCAHAQGLWSRNIDKSIVGTGVGRPRARRRIDARCPRVLVRRGGSGTGEAPARGPDAPATLAETLEGGTMRAIS
jgi:hypothetical protein